MEWLLTRLKRHDEAVEKGYQRFSET